MAWMDPDKVMHDLIDSLPDSAIDGVFNFQLLADGVSVFKNAFVCNVGLKLFDDDPNANSIISMSLL